MMRRSDREILDRTRIDAIIRSCAVCRLGVISDGEPYVVPLSFGYDGMAVYLHMAGSGRKLEALRREETVCLEWDIPGDVIRGIEACAWGLRYASVIAWGRPKVLTDAEARQAGLNHIMAHYAPDHAGEPWTYDPARLARTVVVRISLERVTGKARD